MTKIKELQARCWVTQGDYQFPSGQVFDVDKYTRLLIEELANHIKDLRKDYNNPMSYQHEDYYTQCSAKVDVLDDVLADIERMVKDV